jgi:hypothetical protein
MSKEGSSDNNPSGTYCKNNIFLYKAEETINLQEECLKNLSWSTVLTNRNKYVHDNKKDEFQVSG